MTRTEELLALAEAANVFCNKCGYMGKDEPVHKRPSIGDECGYQGARMMWVRPDDIKQLVELVRLQNAALRLTEEGSEFHACLPEAVSHAAYKDMVQMEQAIEAFNKWENGE